jgi:hypothetical protein
MYYQTLIYHVVWTLCLKKNLKVFMEKIVHYVCFFVCEKFHEKIPIKISIS